MNLDFSASLLSVRNQRLMEARSHLEFVGRVLLEVDDHLMGGPGKAHHESMERLRHRIKFGKLAPVVSRRGVLFSEDATSHSYQIETSRLT